MLGISSDKKACGSCCTNQLFHLNRWLSQDKIKPLAGAGVLLGLSEPVLLIMLRGFALWIAVIIPALWLVVSGLTLQVLDSTGAAVLFAVLVIALVGLVWKSIETKR